MPSNPEPTGMEHLLAMLPKREKGNRRGCSYLHDSHLPPNTSTTLSMAIQLADRWTHRLPCVEEIMSYTGMSRANAYRWVNAFRVARPWMREPTEGEIVAAGGTVSRYRRYVSR